MNETYVTMIGNAVEDPVRRTTQSGTPFVTFRMASTVRRRRPDGEYEDAGTSFVSVMAFRQLARNIADSVSKGQPLVVNGRLRVNRWRTEERSGVSVEIDANSVGHDLSRGVSKFTKVLPLRRDHGSNPARVPGEDRWPGAGPDRDAVGDAVARGEAPYDPDAPEPTYEPELTQGSEPTGASESTYGPERTYGPEPADASGSTYGPERRDGSERAGYPDLSGCRVLPDVSDLVEDEGEDSDELDDGPLDLGGAGGLTARLTG